MSLGSVTEIVYAPSSNPWILSECDLVDRWEDKGQRLCRDVLDRFGLPLPNADAQCENVTDTNPVGERHKLEATLTPPLGQGPVLRLLRSQQRSSHAHVELHGVRRPRA